MQRSSTGCRDLGSCMKTSERRSTNTRPSRSATIRASSSTSRPRPMFHDQRTALVRPGRLRVQRSVGIRRRCGTRGRRVGSGRERRTAGLDRPLPARNPAPAGLDAGGPRRPADRAARRGTRHLRADRTEADDRHPLPEGSDRSTCFELVDGPHMLGLASDRRRAAPGEREPDHADDVLGNRLRLRLRRSSRQSGSPWARPTAHVTPAAGAPGSSAFW